MIIKNIYPEGWKEENITPADKAAADNLRLDLTRQHGEEFVNKLLGPKKAEKKKENFSTEKISETLAERRVRLKAEGILDGCGDRKDGWKASEETFKSNIPAHSTQLMRFRWANQLKNMFTTDAKLTDGTAIRFAGTSIEPGTEIYKVVGPEEVDLIKSGDIRLSVAEGGKFHHIHMGKVTDTRNESVKKETFSNDNEDLTVKPI